MSNSAATPEISADQIDTFRRDGVVMLSNMFDVEWIELLRAGLSRHLAAPTPRARVWDRDDAGRTMFWDSMAWHDVPEYQRFVFESPAAEIAGRLLGSSNALAFVPGSHLGKVVFDQYDFGTLNPDGKTDVDRSDFTATAEPSRCWHGAVPSCHAANDWRGHLDLWTVRRDLAVC